MTFRLSVLDQSPISEGSTGRDALQHSVDLARRAEALGYHRYWVAEHHATPMLACTSPEVLIGAIAAATSRIRVGSGGVMLPHYSPLKVAEVFSLLSALYPDRIDLGLGRAAGTDPLTAFAMQRDRRHAAPDDFPQQLAELLAYLFDRLPQGHRFARLAALPGRPHRPEPWLLGSSAQSGIWAADAGLPYAFADFINPAGAEIARAYRAAFTPTWVSTSPQVIACASVVCADSDDAAERLASSGRMAFALLHRGELIPVPPVETAVRYLAARDDAREGSPLRRRRAVIGSPDTVRRGLEAIAHDYGADEIMIVTITFDHGARCRSYALIADAFGLRPA